MIYHRRNLLIISIALNSRRTKNENIVGKMTCPPLAGRRVTLDLISYQLFEEIEKEIEI